MARLERVTLNVLLPYGLKHTTVFSIMVTMVNQHFIIGPEA